MKKINVLMTGAGAPGAPSIINCLRKNGEREIRIVGVDRNEKANGRKLVDTFYRVPSAEDSMFIDCILNICKKENISVVLPLVTKELLAFSRQREEFEEIGVRVSVDNEDTLKVINNKANLLLRMRELGMETPGFFVASTADEVEMAMERLGYPNTAVCVKEAEGNGSRGVRIVDPKKSRYDLLFNEKPNSMYTSCHDLFEALREKESIPQMVVMEYLPGEEYGVDALCENGRVLYIAGRCNSSVNSSIPQGCMIENRKEPLQIAEKLISLLNISGNINFDFIYDRNGSARLIEINPRVSATIASYAPAGINFPYLRIKQLLGENIENHTLTEGISMQRRYTEVFFDKSGKEINW